MVNIKSSSIVSLFLFISFLLSLEFIVTFTEHLSLRERKLAVTDTLRRCGMEKLFKFVTRIHKGSGIPVLDKSDYVLIKTNSTEIVRALKSASLSKSNRISSVVAQRVFSPALHQDGKQNSEKKNAIRRPKKVNPKKRLSPAYSLSAPSIWSDGTRGQRVRVAVFDTGISRSALSYFNSLADNLDWTDEGINNDVVGHGTFVAGVIASNHDDCPGLAPDAELYSFRIFNKKRSTKYIYTLFPFNFSNCVFIILFKCVTHHGSWTLLTTRYI